MIYGTTTLNILANSIAVRKGSSSIIRHYPGTDVSVKTDLGRVATTISCVIITKSDAERIVIEQLLHSNTETTLRLSTHFYKKVAPNKDFTPKVATPDELTWLITAEFVCLDPIPYDNTTEEALY